MLVNVPVALNVPATVSVCAGLAVPMPTLPAAVITIRSVKLFPALFVRNDKKAVPTPVV